ncbi:MAG: SRPBCC domain-containing protein [Balneolaceae bacterium]|nr:SRPBCC domain-containing protein [Balneolaceae bacterium]
MKRLHYSIAIDAPKKRVWETMLNQDTYRKWTDVFAPGSHYEGDWNKGSKILFLAPNDEGQMEGMVSRIRENREYEFISIEHLGMLQDGKEDTSSAWAGALENYAFNLKSGKTEVSVDVDTEEEYLEMFGDMWPKALQKLKKLAEKKA